MMNKVFLKPKSVKRINFVNMPKVINYEFPHIPEKKGGGLLVNTFRGTNDKDRTSL